MTGKRVATLGDVHGCLDLLIKLHSMLQWESIDEIRHSGDLVDRGPDSGGVVAFCRENNITGVLGNHEGVINDHLRKGTSSKNPDKARTLSQLSDIRDQEYIQNLPCAHVDDSLATVFVHGGLLPKVPWYAQPPKLITHLQLIHPDKPDHSVWFTKDRKGKTEEEYRKEGYRRWYDLWDHEYRVVFGHSVFQNGPLVHKNIGCGETIGVDTGAVFCGQLTAVVLPELKFIHTPKIREFTIWHNQYE